jgi:hypothetical protein
LLTRSTDGMSDLEEPPSVLEVHDSEGGGGGAEILKGANCAETGRIPPSVSDSSGDRGKRKCECCGGLIGKRKRKFSMGNRCGRRRYWFSREDEQCSRFFMKRKYKDEERAVCGLIGMSCFRVCVKMKDWALSSLCEWSSCVLFLLRRNK